MKNSDFGIAGTVLSQINWFDDSFTLNFNIADFFSLMKNLKISKNWVDFLKTQKKKKLFFPRIFLYLSTLSHCHFHFRYLESGGTLKLCFLVINSFSRCTVLRYTCLKLTRREVSRFASTINPLRRVKYF